MGRSLGTGPTTDLASREPVGGVILQSPLLSAIRVVMDTKVTLPVDIFVNQVNKKFPRNFTQVFSRKFKKLNPPYLLFTELTMKSFLFTTEK